MKSHFGCSKVIQRVFQSILMGLLAGFCLNAHAGSEAHGGGGFQCDYGVLLLDLWEAETPGVLTEAGLKIPVSNAPAEEQEKAMLSRLNQINPELGVAVSETLVQLRKTMRSIPPGTQLSPPTDTNAIFYPVGCKLVSIAQYEDGKNTLWIDSSLYAAMSPTQQVALFIHEAIYKLLREAEHAPDSRKARKWVGYLFSDMNFSTPLPPDAVFTFECASADRDYIARGYVNQARDTAIVNVLQAGGSFSFGKTQLVFRDKKAISYLLHLSELPVNGTFTYFDKTDAVTEYSELEFFHWGKVDYITGGMLVADQVPRITGSPGVFLYLFSHESGDHIVYGAIKCAAKRW